MGAIDLLLKVQDWSDAVKQFAMEPGQTVASRIFQRARRPVAGDTARWDVVKFPRRLGPIVGDDAAPPLVNPNDREPMSAPLIHVKISKRLSAYKLSDWRAAGQSVPDVAAEIRDEFAGLKKVGMATVEKACMGALLGSINTADFEGSQVTFNLTQAVETRNGGQWTAAATAILSTELQALTDAYVQKCGLVPGLTIINDVTETYLLKNTEIQTWGRYTLGARFFDLAGNAGTEAVFGGEQFAGMRWVKTIGGYVPTGGAFTKFLADKKVLTLPADVTETLMLAEGYGIVPTAFVGGEGEIPFRRVQGEYAYTRWCDAPQGVELVWGYRFLPVVKNTTAVLVTTVT
mgnify:CR=1 FL=1